jgi:universal stress protein A
MSNIKRMLLPTDFSAASDIAFTYAADMAVGQGCSIHLLHIIDDANYASAFPDGFYVELPSRRAQLADEAARRLDDMAARCRARGVRASVEVAVGRPARVITDAAMQRGTDLIVMGTHGRSGFAHLVLGSVAERVVRTAPCAVLTVRDTSRIADILAGEAVTPGAAADAPQRLPGG